HAELLNCEGTGGQKSHPGRAGCRRVRQRGGPGPPRTGTRSGTGGLIVVKASEPDVHAGWSLAAGGAAARSARCANVGPARTTGRSAHVAEVQAHACRAMYGVAMDPG